MNHTFTIEVEAPDFVSREILAENIRGALTDRIGSQVKFTVNYTPIGSGSYETGPAAGKLATDLTKAAMEPLYEKAEPAQMNGDGKLHVFPHCPDCGSRSLRCGCD